MINITPLSLSDNCCWLSTIQVTLLKQQVSGVKTSTTSASFKDAIFEDSTRRSVDFNPKYVNGIEEMTKLPAASSQDAEIVCGPVELAKFVDLSGTQGIIPLTSVRLLKAKSKSFLLHLKAKSATQDKASEKMFSQVAHVYTM